MKTDQTKSLNHKGFKILRKENMMKLMVKALLALSLLFVNISVAQSILEMNTDEIPAINYHDVNSPVAQRHTTELREAQGSLASVTDFGEEIVFVLNSGINVQFEDGSGRRLLIARGSGFAQFWYPAWSIDGTKIAFSATRTDPRVVDLIVANADGSNPTVILTLSEGYYNSYIQSISWHWASQYIMFTYAYNDNQGNSLFVVCTIHYTGADFTVGPGPDRSFCQYEPVNGSQRYAYIAAGRPFYFNTDLRVSNLDGTNDNLWFQYTGGIACFTHVLWNNPNSIYTVVRNWDQYPNREVLLRVDRINNQTYYTTVIMSDPNASLWSPTASPDRSKLYNSELAGNNASMWLTTLDSNGNPINVVNKGSGMFPNWRQNIPTSDITEGGNLPSTMSLSQNYPNPFNASTTIEYSLSSDEHVTVDVYDLLGKKVVTLYDGYQSAGRHSLNWNADNVASGTYFCRVQAGNQTETRKMSLLK